MPLWLTILSNPATWQEIVQVLSVVKNAIGALEQAGSPNPKAELIDHLTAGKPNSPALGPDALRDK